MVIRNLPGQDRWVSVVVENHGAPRTLSKSVQVEKQVDGVWSARGGEVQVDLVERCGFSPSIAAACIDVGAGAKFTAAPWNGWACGGQCPDPCRMNDYMGPGTFRFVVESCDRKERFEGPPFQLPSEPLLRFGERRPPVAP